MRGFFLSLATGCLDSLQFQLSPALLDELPVAHAQVSDVDTESEQSRLQPTREARELSVLDQ